MVAGAASLLQAALLFSAGPNLFLDGVPVAGKACLALRGDTVVVASAEPSTWLLITPVPMAYENAAGDCRFGSRVDTLLYTAVPIEEDACSLRFVSGEDPRLPDVGTFYLGALRQGETYCDTISSADPLHLVMPGIVQIAIRPGDSYTDYLMETLGTPFLMMPRRTPGGFHQAGDRMGFDCAGLAVYGARRMGLDVGYLGPSGIMEYLEPVVPGLFFPDGSDSLRIYRNAGGECVPVGPGALQPGDIVHFRCQVSVFLEDMGVPGVLDSEDILIQSWFDGTMICTIAENGFYGLPLRVLRWRRDLPTIGEEER